MQPTTIEIIATSLFGVAVIHTFLCSRFQHISHRFPDGSVGSSIFHLLGEVEAVFGFWAGILLIVFAFVNGWHEALEHLDAQNFTEPAFVFAIMTMAATAPVIHFARQSIFGLARVIPFHREIAIYLTCLVIGPLLGSFITEPAAMTVTAMILKRRYYDRNMSGRFMYITIAVLFVNVSIGGTLTPFAAPPVLMVAGTWHWDIGFMLTTFGWKAALAVVINAFSATMLLRKELKLLPEPEQAPKEISVPAWVAAAHLVFLAAVVLTSHHPKIFLGFFLYFLGLTAITKRWQEPLKLRESLLVGFFLAGLVVLGGFQKWWLDSVIRALSPTPLFLGTTALTAFTDNAALTFLGAQVDNVTDAFKYALVAGAVAGGGLTVIANAPNPAGFSILQERFQPDGISPMRLALTALPPTLVAMACLWLLP